MDVQSEFGEKVILMFGKRIVKIGLCIIITVSVLLICFLFSDGTTHKINSIENYESIFQSVNELQFFIAENNFYGTKSPSKELREIKKVIINPEPLSVYQDESRDFEYRIAVDDKFIIYINDDFSQLWLDDKSTVNIEYNNGVWDKEVDEGLLASFSYSVENPGVLENLFKEHSQHINQ